MAMMQQGKVGPTWNQKTLESSFSSEDEPTSPKISVLFFNKRCVASSCSSSRPRFSPVFSVISAGAMANLSVAPLLCPGLLLEAAHSEYDSNYKALPASFPCAHDSKEIILYSYCEARPWTHLYIYIYV